MSNKNIDNEIKVPTGDSDHIAIAENNNHNRKFIAIIRHNNRYFMGFDMTTYKAIQAAVDEANDFCGEDYSVDDYISNYGEGCFEIAEWRAGYGYELDIN